MSTTLIEVNEQSTQEWEIIVKDAGVEVTPTAATYTLTDRDGVVINAVEDEVITPSTLMTVTLAGNDLQIIDDTKKREYRILTIQTDRGNVAKPEKIETHFWVVNLKIPQ